MSECEASVGLQRDARCVSARTRRLLEPRRVDMGTSLVCVMVCVMVRGRSKALRYLRRVHHFLFGCNVVMGPFGPMEMPFETCSLCYSYPIGLRNISPLLRAREAAEGDMPSTLQKIILALHRAANARLRMSPAALALRKHILDKEEK